MKIELLKKCDVERFLKLAGEEGWMTDSWEFDFLLSLFPGGCLCARDETGETVGFVTSMRHKYSGWIGNLIVAPEHRGKGIGEALFLRALQALCEEATKTIWLTASESGRYLYEKHGFRSIDTINRRVGEGAAEAVPTRVSEVARVDISLDRLGWGDERYPLLRALAGRGLVQAEVNAFAILQPYGESLQLGPWAGCDNISARRTALAAMKLVSRGVKVYCDAPASNRACKELLQEMEFKKLGSNELMFSGARPDYRPEYIYSLATMGSCG